MYEPTTGELAVMETKKSVHMQMLAKIFEMRSNKTSDEDIVNELIALCKESAE